MPSFSVPTGRCILEEQSPPCLHQAQHKAGAEMRWKNTGELAWEGRVLRSRSWLSGAAAQRAETRFHSFERVRTYCVLGTERGQRVGGRVRSRPHPQRAHSPSHKPSKASLT